MKKKYSLALNDFISTLLNKITSICLSDVSRGDKNFTVKQKMESESHATRDHKNQY